MGNSRSFRRKIGKANTFEQYASKYDSVDDVGMGEGAEVSGKKRALKTEGLGLCLGVAVSSLSEQVARLVHFPGSEQEMHSPAYDFINNGLELKKPKIRIVSPFTASKLDEYTEKPVMELREFLNENFKDNPAVQLEFLNRGQIANILAVGTDGTFYLKTSTVPEVELLRGDLNYELNFHAQRHSSLDIPHPIQIQMFLNTLGIEELTRVMLLSEEEKLSILEKMLEQVLNI